MNLSNRQALLISDSIFNRQGVVPGILEAIITAESSTYREKKSFAEVKTAAGNNFYDATLQVMLEHERQIADNGGFLNLFYEPFYKEKPPTLKDMGIEKYMMGAKTLWIRFVRAGDGERCFHGTPIKWDNYVNFEWAEQKAEVPFDLGIRDVHTVITKAEFMSCLLNSPLLGESLRRMNASDTEQLQRSSLQLEVKILDPQGLQDDLELAQATDVSQSLLLEVWDGDLVSKDFLGEVWLPPLSELTSNMKDYVLPLNAPDFTEEAENGPSRHVATKEPFKKGAPKDPKKTNMEITGDLYVSAAWEYPAYRVDETGKVVVSSKRAAIPGDFHQVKKHKEFDSKLEANRGETEEKLHTGMLTLKIARATNLRRSDAAKGKDCDPQVQLWIRNDAMENGHGRWKKRHLHRTKTITNDRNPVWKDEKPMSYDIMQGEYESRFPPKDDTWSEAAKNLFKSSRQKRYQREERAAQAVRRFGKDGLTLMFGSAAKRGEEGSNHRVDLYMSDTIRDFKVKCTEACNKEFAYWENMGNTKSTNAAKYQDIVIGYAHLVMVFIAPQSVIRLQEQRLQGKPEYEHKMKNAIVDPSNWQPLDPSETFENYSRKYHFGQSGREPPKIQIIEATDLYKKTNLRYKAYAEARNQESTTDMNRDDQCFGWALYEHENDGLSRSTEWRQAIIKKAKPEDIAAYKSERQARRQQKSTLQNAMDSDSDEPHEHDAEPTNQSRPDAQQASRQTVEDAPPMYQVSWLFNPTTLPDDLGIANTGTTASDDSTAVEDISSAPTQTGQGQKNKSSTVMKASKVILAPKNPKMAVSFHPKHAEVLPQAKMLRGTGKSDFEIEAMLNKILEDDYAAGDSNLEASEKVLATKPPRITVDIIRNYLEQNEKQGDK